MMENYSTEARKTSVAKKFEDQMAIHEDNYQIFLKKYLEKGEDGRWRRKEDMWTLIKKDGKKVKEDTWIPNKSTSN